MFVVMLRFGENKAQAGQFMDGHNQWLGRGFEAGVFVAAGSIKSGQGGTILAHGVALAELESLVAEDPFVQEKVVAAEIIEIELAKADDRLAFMLSDA